MNRNSIVAIVAVLALGLGGASAALAARAHHPRVPRLKVSSEQIARGATIADEQVTNAAGWGCNGGNVSPEVKWSGAPAGTKSFAVTLYDPDAPTGSGFWHWLVFDIPATVTELPKNAGDPKAHLLPPGAMQGREDFGAVGYNGPCPPAGDPPHRYRLTVFALNVDKLGVGPDTMPAVVGFNINAHTLAKGTIVGKYGRAK